MRGENFWVRITTAIQYYYFFHLFAVFASLWALFFIHRDLLYDSDTELFSKTWSLPVGLSLHNVPVLTCVVQYTVFSCLVIVLHCMKGPWLFVRYLNLSNCIILLSVLVLWHCSAVRFRVFIMRPSSVGWGRILRCTLSVRLSVCLSVRLSVCPSVPLLFILFYSRTVLRANIQNRKTSVFAYGPASRMYF